MDVGTCIVSKANSLRFAHIDGNLPQMDNTLACNDNRMGLAAGQFEQIFFDGDVVLLQVKAELSTDVELRDILTNEVPISPAAVTEYTDAGIKILDYLLTMATTGGGGTTRGEVQSQYSVTADKSTWISEVIRVIEPASDYKLIQWTNLDPGTSTFEFDYNTTQANENVNFMRLLCDTFEYSAGGETEVYNNQNEKSVLKASVFNNFNFDSGFVPRGIAEKLSIAMAHDRFLVNQVAYIVEEKPEITTFGTWAQLIAGMTYNLSLGMNTHDIGFDCDDSPDAPTTNTMVRNVLMEGVTGQGSATIREGHAINQIIVESAATVDTYIKLGTTVNGEEIMRSYKLTSTDGFNVISRNYLDELGLGAVWTIYYDITGDACNIYLQTIDSKTANN